MLADLAGPGGSQVQGGRTLVLAFGDLWSGCARKPSNGPSKPQGWFRENPSGTEEFLLLGGFLRKGVKN